VEIQLLICESFWLISIAQKHTVSGRQPCCHDHWDSALLRSKVDLCSLFMIFRYQIGLRYTGGARMLLMLSLKFSIIPIMLPVSVRDFDIDGELWVKLRLIPTEPWVGAASWAFVSLPKIKFELSPFRLFNLMGRS
jgi:hypothetical protein